MSVVECVCTFFFFCKFVSRHLPDRKNIEYIYVLLFKILSFISPLTVELIFQILSESEFTEPLCCWALIYKKIYMMRIFTY